MGYGNAGLLYGLTLVIGLLVFATVVAYLFNQKWPSAESVNTLRRIRTWWVIAVCFFAALWLGPLGLTILFALVSILSLAEFVQLDADFENKKSMKIMLGMGAVIHYAIVYFEGGLILILLAGVMVVTSVFFISHFTISRVNGYFEPIFNAAATTQIVFQQAASKYVSTILAYLLLVVGLSCVVEIALLEMNAMVTGHTMTIVFLLVLLTAINDIAQYLWGKRFGNKKVCPKISPNKTWSGLVGGVATTVILTTVLFSGMLSIALSTSITIGFLIGVGGFLGDIIISLYKRRVGAKDSGTLLPGHGGLLDRVDSLCLTAPLLYLYIT